MENYKIGLGLLLLGCVPDNAIEVWPHETARSAPNVEVFVVPGGESLGTEDCIDVENSLDTAVTAYSRAAQLFDINGYYDSASLDRDVYVCFVSNPIADRYTGLQLVDRVWISMTANNGTAFADAAHTPLCHEFVHQILFDSCILDFCEADGNHDDARFFGNNSITNQCYYDVIDILQYP